MTSNKKSTPDPAAHIPDPAMLLASKTAHEINNICTAVMSNLKIMNGFWRDLDKEFDAKFNGHTVPATRMSDIRKTLPVLMDEMEEGARRIAHIATSIQRHAAGHKPERVSIQIDTLLECALKIARHHWTKPVAVVKDIHPDVPALMCDETGLSQVFVNLFINAGAAMRGPERPAVITLQAHPHDRQVTITVSDTGLGMNEEHLKRLFQPFFTTRRSEGGTGLGLYISREIIQQHGGSIQVESRHGKGTTFTIILPLAEDL